MREYERTSDRFLIFDVLERFWSMLYLCGGNRLLISVYVAHKYRVQIFLNRIIEAWSKFFYASIIEGLRTIVV